MRFISLMLLFILVLFAPHSQAQKVTEGPYEFSQALYDEFHDFRKDSSSRQINLDSFDQVFFQSNSSFLGIEQISRWMPHFCYRYSWEHVQGQFSETDSGVFHGLSDTITHVKQFIHGSRMVYSAESLLEGLEIDVQYWNPQKPYLSDFPLIMERDDPLNHTWIPIISGEYLVLRFVHSYPNGNLTSFYRETRFYFKRAP